MSWSAAPASSSPVKALANDLAGAAGPGAIHGLGFEAGLDRLRVGLDLLLL